MAYSRRFRNIHAHGKGFRAVIQIDGKRHWLQTYPTKEEAAESAVLFIQARGPAVRGTIGEAMQLVREEIAARNLKPATLRYWECHWRSVLKRWSLGTPLDAITPQEVGRWVGERLASGIGGTTARHDVKALRRLLTIAVKRKRLQSDPLAGYVMPRKNKPQRHVFGGDQIAGFVAKLREANIPRRNLMADVMELAYRTGLRRTELSQIRAEDVNLPAKKLYVHGKNRARSRMISPPVAVILRRLLAAGRDPLIGSTILIGHLFEEAKGILGVDTIHCHAMRHSFATALAEGGTHPYRLTTEMGHSSLQEAMTYYHDAGTDAAAGDAILDRAWRQHSESAPPAPPDRSLAPETGASPDTREPGSRDDGS